MADNKKKNIDKDEDILYSLEDDDLEEKKEGIDKWDIEDTFDNEIGDDYSEVSVRERVESIERKLNIVLILVVITLLFCGINTIVNLSDGESYKVDLSNGNSNSDGDSTYSYDTSDFKEIKASEIASASKSETLVIWIGRQGCSFCQSYAPIIAEVAKEYGITARYLDLAKIVDFSGTQARITDTEAWDTLNSLTGNGDWAKFVSENITGTPLTFIVKNNKVIGGLPGYGDATKVKEAFDEAGLSK